MIDSELLLLLVVGSASRAYVSRHKRLGAYTEADFDLLLEVLGQASEVTATPNSLTETSNLLAQIGEPLKTELFAAFAQVMRPLPERYIESGRASGRGEFIRLGLTDSVLLIAAGEERVLLTADAKLYMAALNGGSPAVNFNHERESRGLI